jgi:methionine--tRNA ligase beta chain
LRVGRIVECEPHPDSEHLYREKVDVGEGTLRDIGSGLNHKIPVEEMLKGEVLVWVNLKPRKLADIMSNGMIMCASNEDKSVVELIRPPAGSKVGDRIQLTGNPINGQPLSQEYEQTLNPKKKIEPKFMDKLLTNDKCEATYNGYILETSKGILTS